MRPTWVYILRCADDSYYVGTYRGELIETRLYEHNSGHYPKAYTYKRRPVILLWADKCEWAVDAIALERRLKRWSRAKKEAFIREDWDELQRLSKRERVKDKRETQ